MEVTFWIQTDKVYSKCKHSVDFDIEDFSEMTDKEIEDYLEEVGKDIIWNMAEWGFTPVSEIRAMIAQREGK